MRRAGGDRGQVVPLVAVVLTVAALCVVGLARLGGEAGGRAAAQALADVVALAGAVDGPGAAGELAVANGGELVAFAQAEPFVQVSVRRGRYTARATAEVVPEAAPAALVAPAPAPAPGGSEEPTARPPAAGP